MNKIPFDFKTLERLNAEKIDGSFECDQLKYYMFLHSDEIVERLKKHLKCEESTMKDGATGISEIHCALLHQYKYFGVCDKSHETQRVYCNTDIAYCKTCGAKVEMKLSKEYL